MSRTFANQRPLRDRLAAFTGRLRADRSGFAGVLTAIAAPVIIGFAALAIDASMWQVNQRQMQGAADQAAIGGVNAYLLQNYNDDVGTNQVAKDAALGVAASFGYSACTTQPAQTADYCTNGYGAVAGEVENPTSATCIGAPQNCLEVTITQKQSHFLSSIVYSGTVVAKARAVATLDTGSGGNCVLALDGNNGSPSTAPPSVGLAGNGLNLTLNACSLMNDLNDLNSIKETTGNGNPTVNLNNGAEFKLAQQNPISGSIDFKGATTEANFAVIPAGDPYASRTPPSVTGCTYPGSSNTVKGAFDNTQTFSGPPTRFTNTAIVHVPYTDPTTGTAYDIGFTPTSPNTPLVFCGGINATGGNIFFGPGIYIMDGGSGFQYQGNGAVTSRNATIYVTCEQTYYTSLTKDPWSNQNTNFTSADCVTLNKYPSIKITGTGGSGSSNLPKVTFTPPCDTSNGGTTGAPCTGTDPPSGVDGIAVWMDRDAPKCTSTQCSQDKFSGDANLSINGVIYEPSRAVSYQGGATGGGKCNALVANTISMGGNRDTTFDQSGCSNTSGVAHLAPAKLIE